MGSGSRSLNGMPNPAKDPSTGKKVKSSENVSSSLLSSHTNFLFPTWKNKPFINYVVTMSECLEYLQQIAHLNKVGVSCLATGRRGEAVKAFTNALVVLSRVTHHPSSDELFQYKVQQCSMQPIGGMEKSFYLYSNAFVFEASMEADIAFCSGLILFNLALAFHQKGIQSGQEARLRKALSLYDLATQLISEISASTGALLLAALNNSAQVQFELGDYHVACETLELLQGEAMHVPSGILEQEHIDQFFLNVALTRPPTTAASA